MSLPGTLYNATLLPARLLVAPMRLARGERGKDFDSEYSQRLGRDGIEGPCDIWIQAASVGEVRGAGGLIGYLLGRDPALSIGLTTTTRTGRVQAAILSERYPIRAAYFPLDFPSVARAAVARARAALFVPFETEIWPNLWAAASRAGARIALVNGRISPKSFPRYKLARPLLRQTLGLADRIAARTPEDAERFVALGADPARVEVTGDTKYDLGPPPGPDAVESFARAIGLPPGTPLLAAGSTAEGEDPIVLEAFRNVTSAFPEARLLLAPRHPERAAAAAAEARRLGLGARLRSSLPAGALPPAMLPGSVLILDTIGELREAYGAATAAFVGGSLVPAGGQNLLEPASAGLAPVTGPHTENFQDPALRLERAAALVRVSGARDLAAALLDALQRPGPAREAGARARAAVEQGSGATARTADILLGLLGRAGRGSAAGLAGAAGR